MYGHHLILHVLSHSFPTRRSSDLAFESAGDFSPGGSAPAYEAGCWGLIDRSGAWASAPDWDDINWDDALHAYVTQRGDRCGLIDAQGRRSEEHTSEFQSLMRISYAVFCLKKKIKNSHNTNN